jgi:hypothetical protein
VGAAPQLAYRLFLESLAARGVLVRGVLCRGKGGEYRTSSCACSSTFCLQPLWLHLHVAAVGLINIMSRAHMGNVLLVVLCCC